MFRTVAAKALLGAGALALAAGTTALAASPAAGSALQAVAGTQKPAHHHAANTRGGVVIKVTDSQLVVERTVRDKSSKATTKDDTTYQLTAATRVFRAGSKDPVGREAIKVGERVRVRFTASGNDRVANRVVIVPDLRAGKVIAKGNDYFVLHTARHGDVRVTITDKTRFTTGHRQDRKDGSFAAMKVGDRATAIGEEDSSHNFDAAAVRYNDAAASKPGAPGAPKGQ